jgi:ribose transport system ATP-binding protein
MEDEQASNRSRGCDQNGGRDRVMPALELLDLRKSYDGVHALQGASLVCAFGEVHGLIGENGAGKSTLVKVVSGAVRPDAGTVKVGGEELQLRNPRDAQRAGIGTVFQELSLIPDLTVAANLLYGMEPRVRLGRVDRRRLIRRATDVLAAYDVDGIDPTALTRDLDLADRQVVEIVKVLLREPRVLVLDESTSALLTGQVKWFFDQVSRFAAGGGAVLFISHRLEEIQGNCSQVTVFRGGVDVGTGPIEEMPESRMVELMLGRAVERVFPPRAPAPDAPTPLCEVRELSAEPRLRGVSFDVMRGEILGVAGLQGQGQAQLFLSLFGALPHDGAIAMHGAPVRLRRPGDALAAGIALVPEDRASEGLCLGLPIRDNISLGSLGSLSRLGLVSPTRERALVGAAAERLSIRMSDQRQEVSALSGGNQQKVLLARVLAHEPALLLMFDATRGVDVGTKVEIYILMRELCERGVSILFYSSDVFELANLSDRVIVLHDGRVRALLTGDELDERRILAAVVGGAGDSR